MIESTLVNQIESSENQNFSINRLEVIQVSKSMIELFTQTTLQKSFCHLDGARNCSKNIKISIAFGCAAGTISAWQLCIPFKEFGKKYFDEEYLLFYNNVEHEEPKCKKQRTRKESFHHYPAGVEFNPALALLDTAADNIVTNDWTKNGLYRSWRRPVE